jgi:hypothetical protein
MPDSDTIPFPGRDFDATDPDHLSIWLKTVTGLPAPRPETYPSDTTERAQCAG